jgi:hypothetical protein
VENIWNEEFAELKGKSRSPAGMTTRRATAKAATTKSESSCKSERLRGSAAFSDLYSSILSN